ncbi:MAG: DUF2249 domain-containing protein [Sulfobacillus sp.]|nr:DUF2249 domain-containing protein [Sulfobacillus sp.]
MTNDALVLNAWQFPAAIRHDVIFGLLAALPVDHSLLLVNDHDPKPLFYQLDAEQPGRFRREYQEAPSPDHFAVRITRITA